MFWRFKQPKDTPVLADAEVLDGSEQLFLIRRTRDGQWLFRHQDHQEAGPSNLRPSTLGQIAKRNRFIKNFAGLEPGHQAWRADEEGHWDEGPLPEGDTFYVQFEATPSRDLPGFEETAGAFVNCWIRTISLQAAIAQAQVEIRDFGWIVGDPDEAYEVTRSGYEEGDDPNNNIDRFEQAQDDGTVFVYHCYLVDETDEGVDNDDKEQDGMDS